uniref:ribosomal protein S11 n=1 Tax=Hydrocytium acuminatum TaxID=1745963 RepID=UPI002A7F095F|nr:ribosomal protein S11 [Hydrocytium acuminatum]WOR09561.1 ribosomal protein S11 [Hydrocytium acuminatum]
MAKTKTKKIQKSVRTFKNRAYRGVVHIQTGRNNTIITITNIKGDVLCWSSAGSSGLKGKRKSTAYAAKLAATNAVRKAIRDFKIVEAKILINGAGSARESALNEISKAGIRLTVIREKSGTPHNGCRAPKRRRV